MIVQRVTSNSAMVCGVFIPRPPGMGSCDWRDFWEHGGKTLVNFDAFRAMVFGAVIPKPPTVTQFEWETFWQTRSSRPPLQNTNRAAEAAYDNTYMRQHHRTARKP